MIANIVLDRISDIKTFNQIASGVNGIVDVRQGRHVVDGKSFLGLLTLDLEQPIEVCIVGSVSPDAVYELRKFQVITDAV